MTLMGGEVPERVSVMWSSAGDIVKFSAFRPIVGRWFDAEEESVRSDRRSAVISHSLCSDISAASKSVSERTLILNRRSIQWWAFFPRDQFPRKHRGLAADSY